MEAPGIHPKLTAALEAFRAAGVQPTDNEIIWLAQLRLKCDRPSDGSLPWIIGAPFKFAGVDFWPLHRLGESWFLRSFELLKGSLRDQVFVFLYAHAHSGKGDVSLRDLTDGDTIRQTLTTWSDALPIHDDELDQLCDRLRELDGDGDAVPDPGARKTEENDAPRDESAKFAAIMCKAFPGPTPDYWLTEIAASDARAMLAGVGSEDFAESSERTEAIKNFLKAIKWVWFNHGK